MPNCYVWFSYRAFWDSLPVTLHVEYCLRKEREMHPGMAAYGVSHRAVALEHCLYSRQAENQLPKISQALICIVQQRAWMLAENIPVRYSALKITWCDFQQIHSRFKIDQYQQVQEITRWAVHWSSVLTFLKYYRTAVSLNLYLAVSIKKRQKELSCFPLLIIQALTLLSLKKIRQGTYESLPTPQPCYASSCVSASCSSLQSKVGLTCGPGLPFWRHWKWPLWQSAWSWAAVSAPPSLPSHGAPSPWQTVSGSAYLFRRGFCRPSLLGSRAPLSSAGQNALCAEILGSCFILRQSRVWLCCWPEFETFLRPRDWVLRITAPQAGSMAPLGCRKGAWDRTTAEQLLLVRSPLTLKLALWRSSYILSLYIRLIIMQNSRRLRSWK